jgi:hypothetical protein
MYTRGWGLKAWWNWFRYEGFPLWVAKQLPDDIVYWCFIRVHAAGEPNWPFDVVAKNWERRKK